MRELSITVWVFLCLVVLQTAMYDLDYHLKFNLLFLSMSCVSVLMLPVIAFVAFYVIFPSEDIKQRHESLDRKADAEEWKSRVIFSRSLIFISSVFLVMFWILGVKLGFYDVYLQFFYFFTAVSIYVMVREIKMLPLRNARYEETSRYKNC